MAFDHERQQRCKAPGTTSSVRRRHVDMNGMRIRSLLLVLATVATQTLGSSGSSSSSWQQSSSQGRPDAPGYLPPDQPPRNDPRYSTQYTDRYGGEDDRREYSERYHNDAHRYQHPDHGYSMGGASEDPSRQRPPPPPPGSSSSYTPINYQFPAADQQQSRDTASRESSADAADDVPRTNLDRPDDADETTKRRNNDDDREYASPRDDVITRYMSTKQHRMILTLSSGTVGMALGSFVGKSLMNNPKPFAMAFFSLFILCTFLRNAYGELSRALGMALILSVQKTRDVRKAYPCWPHFKASVGAGPRIPTDSLDERYNAMYSLLAMLLVGFAVGASLPIPLFPTWMGAMAGGATLALSTTLPTANGDLARTMGMRVVMLFEEVFDINAELNMMRKLGVVSGKVLDKMLVLDRKHRIKDRIIAAVSWGYEQVSRTAQQVQSDDRDDEVPRRREGDRQGNSEPAPREERDRWSDEPPRR